MRRNLHAGKSQSGGFSLNTFSEDELYEIHLATLEILDETGVFVEDSLRSAPAKIVLAGRDPKNDFVVENNRVGVTNFGEGVQVVDPFTGEFREPTKQDVADTAKVVNFLDDVDVYNLAGTLGEHNAELLAAVTLNHITRKGAKIIYGSSTTALDLRFGSASVGSPECAMLNAAVARLARYYGLPSFVAGG